MSARLDSAPGSTLEIASVVISWGDRCNCTSCGRRRYRGPLRQLASLILSPVVRTESAQLGEKGAQHGERNKRREARSR